MADRRIRRLPVVQGETVLGVCPSATWCARSSTPSVSAIEACKATFRVETSQRNVT